MPSAHQIRAHIITSPDHVAGRLLRHAGNPDRHDLTQPQQTGQMQRIPGIGLHPVPSRTLHPRRREHLTADTRRRQRPRQSEPRRPGFIGHRDRARQLAQPPQDLTMIWTQPRPEQLTGIAIDTARHNRPRMHIQTDTHTLTEHRDLRKCRHYRPQA